MDVLTAYFTDLNEDKNTYDMNEVVRAEDKSMFENEFLNAPFEECEVMRVLEKL